jgi:hypothetical protein
MRTYEFEIITGEKKIVTVEACNIREARELVTDCDNWTSEDDIETDTIVLDKGKELVGHEEE